MAPARHRSAARTGDRRLKRRWLRVEWLPKYAPEPNDIARHFLAHRTFRDADGLDAAVHDAVRALNGERRAAVCAVISNAA
jgi:hypothetical protein